MDNGARLLIPPIADMTLSRPFPFPTVACRLVSTALNFSKKSPPGSGPSASQLTLTGLSCCSALRNPALNKSCQSPWHQRACLCPHRRLKWSKSTDRQFSSRLSFVGRICRISTVVCLMWPAVVRVWLTDWNRDRTAGKLEPKNARLSL